MTLSLQAWHRRFQQQARWTQSLRTYAYQRADIHASSKVLEVGCGTGIILEELIHLPVHLVFGIDINQNSIIFMQDKIPQAGGIVGDALRIPCKNATFDACLCHFLLLWVTDPTRALSEMIRVTRSGGYVMALAEPDYGGRIDYPNELAQIGIWQIKSLKSQGANPLIGRELRSIFTRSDLVNVEIGVLGGQWDENEPEEDISLEWQVIQSDLQHIGVTDTELNTLRTLDESSRASHHRILYVPTFYAMGQVVN